MITQDRLKDILHYDLDTGIFSYNHKLMPDGNRRMAGHFSSQQYFRISIDAVPYFAHHLAWLYVHGEWPAGEIDHINRIRYDNSINNLRVCNRSQNQLNTKMYRTNKSGFKGVYWHTRQCKWIASIFVSGKRYHLGQFNTPEEASCAYLAFDKIEQKS